MLIKNKRELFWLRHRFRIVISVFSVVGLVFGFLGSEYAVFEKFSGIADCRGIFDLLWKCAVLPLAAIVISLAVGNPRKKIISLMIAKIAVTLVGLVFGINTNIRMAVLPADWEALFFLAVDVCIILAVCRSRDAKMRVTSLIALTAAMMLTSHLIMQIKGEFAFDYAYRILYLMLFYFSAGYVVNCTMRRRMTFPTPEEWAKIQEKEGENDD